MNADDLEIDIENFIYEIQIRPRIWDLVDRHTFIKSRYTVLNRANKKTLSGFARRSA